jgi:hypothetical protein
MKPTNVIVRLRCKFDFECGEHKYKKGMIYYALVKKHSLFGRCFYMLDENGFQQINSSDKAPYNVTYFKEDHSKLEELPYNSIDFILEG